MTSIDHITLEVTDTAAAEKFYADAFDGVAPLRFRASDAASTGFRGFTLSLIVSQPANAVSLIDTALAAGATSLKPATKSLWGFGGVVQAPDGTIWQVSTSNKKDTAPVSRNVDEIVLLLGVEDVAATKQFYTERGIPVAKSFGKKYVEFDTSGSPVKLALYKRKGLAKVAGVSPEGSGSHRIVVGGDLGAFTDPDGFTWENANHATPA
ncbi:putative glyoxalase superfamily protein PhnB [Stackebrandtia albiflava]|uniref:Putative glyoxalase superfamily protein PhnB n=1 Tax=Stackebrandtia albiflava TaxID=406432 RepID=A0A562UQ81_9ACTN|nr:glyoxalase [Stackebrandtia albiflava]TWJ07782.1 putative glyoxalase superfamily protein PhnB [Stackebrandtia albiflava]